MSQDVYPSHDPNDPMIRRNRQFYIYAGTTNFYEPGCRECRDRDTCHHIQRCVKYKCKFWDAESRRP